MSENKLRFKSLVEEIYSNSSRLGGRLIGTEGSEWMRNYLKSKLEEFGLEPETNTYTTKTWIPKYWQAEVYWENKWITLDSYFMARTKPGTVEGELKLVEDAHSHKVSGVENNIVVSKLMFPSLDLTMLEAVALGKSDPLNQIRHKGDKPSVFMTRLHPSECGCPVDPESYEASMKAGAIGYMAILENYPEMDCGKFSFYAPSDGEFRDLPGLWIHKNHAGELIEMAKAGGKARLTLEADVKEADGVNIYAVIPGKSEETIIVHSHYDAPYGGAVQDASGVSTVLMLAEHYAKKYKEGWTPKRTLVFLFTDGHFDAGSGQYAFVDHWKNKDSIMVDIAIEHIGKEYIVKDGVAVPTGDPEPRGLFISENKQELVIAFLTAMEVAKPHSLLLLPTQTPLGVPSDANKFWKLGVPVASLISGPLYMFSECDTPDKLYIDDIDNLLGMYTKAIDQLSQ